MQIQKILVPVDFSPPSRAALDYAVFLGAALKAVVEVLTVWEPPHYIAPDVMLAMPGFDARSLEHHGRDRARQELDAWLGTKLRETIASRVDVGEAAATIVRNATADTIVVMGTRGRSNALERMLVGSVTQRVIAHAPCPVLVVGGAASSPS